MMRDLADVPAIEILPVEDSFEAGRNRAGLRRKRDYKQSECYRRLNHGAPPYSRPISRAGLRLAIMSISGTVIPAFIKPVRYSFQASFCKGRFGWPVSLERKQCSGPTAWIARA